MVTEKKTKNGRGETKNSNKGKKQKKYNSYYAGSRTFEYLWRNMRKYNIHNIRPNAIKEEIFRKK